MNRRGFTLIELLGVIIILSLIMLIAVPNIASTLDRSKKEQYIVDARKFVSLVEYELRKGNINKPSSTEIWKITLGYINTNDLENDADNNKYDLNNSYVIVARKNGVLTYFVNLVAQKGTKYKGVGLVNSEDLTKDTNTGSSENKYNLVKTDVPILTEAQIRTKIGITGGTFRTFD